MDSALLALKHGNLLKTTCCLCGVLCVLSRCFLSYVFIYSSWCKLEAQCALESANTGYWNKRDLEMKSGTFIQLNLEIIG